MKTITRLILAMAFIVAMVTPSWALPDFSSNFVVSASSEQPPDASGAVGGSDGAGSSYVVTSQNLRVSIHLTNGTDVTWTKGQNFWSQVNNNCLDTGPDDTRYCNVDPRVIFDSVGGHWILTAIQHNGAATYLAVSKTNNPTGDWWEWQLESGLHNGCGLYPTGETVDEPMLAINSYWIVVLEHCYSSNGVPGEELHVFDRANVESGSAPTDLSGYPIGTGVALGGLPNGGDNPLTDRTINDTNLYFINPVVSSTGYGTGGTQGGFDAKLSKIYATGVGHAASVGLTTVSIKSQEVDDMKQGSWALNYLTGMAPLVPTKQRTYYLDGNLDPLSCANSNPVLGANAAGNTGNGDVDHWVENGGSTVAEFAFTAKRGGTDSNGINNGSVWVGVITYNVNTNIWSVENSSNGDYNGAYEPSYVSIGHVSAHGHDYQIMPWQNTGHFNGADIDELVVSTWKDRSNFGSAAYSWPASPPCGRWGDYTWVAPDPNYGNGGKMWYFSPWITSTTLFTNAFGSVTLDYSN